jgi:hypothetical protein
MVMVMVMVMVIDGTRETEDAFCDALDAFPFSRRRVFNVRID